MPDERHPLFSYCLAIGAREFAIQITRDGVIHWDDYQERRRSRGAVTQHHVGSIKVAGQPEAGAKFTDKLSL